MLVEREVGLNKAPQSERRKLRLHVTATDRLQVATQPHLIPVNVRFFLVLVRQAPVKRSRPLLDEVGKNRWPVFLLPEASVRERCLPCSTLYREVDAVGTDVARHHLPGLEHRIPHVVTNQEGESSNASLQIQLPSRSRTVQHPVLQHASVVQVDPTQHVQPGRGEKRGSQVRLTALIVHGRYEYEGKDKGCRSCLRPFGGQRYPPASATRQRA